VYLSTLPLRFLFCDRADNAIKHSLFGLRGICDQSGQNNCETNHYQVSHKVAAIGHLKFALSGVPERC